MEAQTAAGPIEDGYDVDWEKVKHGQWFTATISGRRITGQVFKGMSSYGIPRAYLCQAEREGSAPWSPGGRRSDISPWPYSWVMDGEVRDLEFHEKRPRGARVPEAPARIKLNAAYTAILRLGHIEVGCQVITNETVRELAAALVDEKPKKRKAAKKAKKKAAKRK